MSSGSSDVVEDHINMALSCAMEKVMGMLAAGVTGSSSALRLKRCRRYINHDHKVTHLRLHHDYFDDDCLSLSYFH
jgi:hypothetical protein